MYAIIADSGKQFKVEEGQKVQVDYREVKVGDAITFDQVLAVRNETGLKIGHPTLAGASVTAEVVAVTQGPKLVIQRLRRRKNSRRKTGHRQIYTEVLINSIVG
ncbi:MAG: 50S ribosomal protein L21 [Planctomycetes bacterium]|nr:50S ribosomal protein L21 [Planctomycetota bacterium]